MAAVILALRARRRRREHLKRIEWKMKDPNNPFEISNNLFEKKYRLSKDATWMLIEELRPYLSVRREGYAIELQVLITLHIMGSGSFQHVSADASCLQISQSSASRFFAKVVKALFQIAKKYIVFPTAASDLQQVSVDFYSKFGFPNVCGAIDCTHFYIQRPSCSDWFVYLNRKSEFSINVQMVCDANLKILDVVARWPGSSEDSHVWNLSGLRHLFNIGRIPQNTFLLGDKSYPLENWLLTPYRAPCSPPEVIFNLKQSKTRSVIERCFRLKKARFRLLHESRGVLSYTPEKTCQIVIAAAVLYNICHICNVPPPPEYDEDIEHEDDDDDDNDNNNGDHVHICNVSRTARQIRDDLAMRFGAST